MSDAERLREEISEIQRRIYEQVARSVRRWSGAVLVPAGAALVAVFHPAFAGVWAAVAAVLFGVLLAGAGYASWRSIRRWALAWEWSRMLDAATCGHAGLRWRPPDSHALSLNRGFVQGLVPEIAPGEKGTRGDRVSDRRDREGGADHFGEGPADRSLVIEAVIRGLETEDHVLMFAQRSLLRDRDLERLPEALSERLPKLARNGLYWLVYPGLIFALLIPFNRDVLIGAFDVLPIAVPTVLGAVVVLAMIGAVMRAAIQSGTVLGRLTVWMEVLRINRDHAGSDGRAG